MRTLHLRGVPDEVAERLERMAALEGLSVTALAVRELAAASRRVDNPALLGALDDIGIVSSAFVDDLDAERSAR